MDYLGRIAVPEVAASGTFPLTPSWGFSQIFDPPVITHCFGSANAKIEQRFLLGSGARRFRASFGAINETQRQALRDFWEARKGAYQPFTLNWPNDDGIGTTAYTVRFEAEPIGWEYLADAVSRSAVGFVEVKTADFPEYTVNETQERFPSAALQTALLDQVQQIIPLIYLRVREAAVDPIYLSDRRCTVGGQLYQARLLSWDGISQEIGGASDQAAFIFGNADRVMRDLANDTDLDRATIRFSLYHVGTGIKLDLWQGQVTGWNLDAGPEFALSASDGLYELNLAYPTRKVSRQCWKVFMGPQCPYVGPHPSCDKGFETPNGCQYHAMDNYFGGILAKPYGGQPSERIQAINKALKIQMAPTSQVSDSIFGEAVPEIYTGIPLKVQAKLAAGREEHDTGDKRDFYDALGVVGEGPLTAYGPFPTATNLTHSLDNQPPHGPDPLGLRTSLGGNYLTGENPDPFSLGQGIPQVYGPERAAGTAFVELRRLDPKGLQLTKLAEHEMKVTVNQGLGGWTWSAPGVRVWTAPLINPIWIGVNAYLRVLGLRAALAADQEATLDIAAAIAAAAICDASVLKIIGDGYETQFTFAGILREQRPLRDWLSDILMGCQGYYSWACGKLRLGVRCNSSALEAFTIGNTLFNSLRLDPARPSANHITAHFGDSDYEFADNTVMMYEVDHAALISGAGPVFLTSDMNLVGVAGKSQAARLITTHLREELGGISAAEWRAARQLAFQTTILALNIEPGMVCSMTHADMPGGAGEFRVQGWRLNRDYSIDVWGRTTTDSMYDLTIGPKPADVIPTPPVEEVVDLVPGDVVPIGVDAFLVTKAEDGAKVTLTITYSPPDPIGVFRGVGIHLVMPTQNPEAMGDFDYDGDSEGVGEARYGHCVVTHAQPVLAEDWDVYLTSRSRAYRKPLDLASTPKRTISIAARNIEASVPISDVSNIQLVSNEPIEADAADLTHDVIARIELSYTAPDPLGTPPADFQGVNVHIETPDGRAQNIGWQFYGGGPGGTGSVIIKVPYPAQAEQWTVHLTARSELYQNKLEIGTTPHIHIDMPADPLTSPAPDIEFFQAGRIADDNSFVAEFRWDELHERMLADYFLSAPATRINWKGVAIWIRAPKPGGGYYYQQATGLTDLSGFTEQGGDHYLLGDIAIQAADLPTPSETWRLLAVSYNRKGEPNTTGGNPTGLYVDLVTLTPRAQLTGMAVTIGEYGYDEKTEPKRAVARVNVAYVNAVGADENTYYDFWSYSTTTAVTDPPDAKYFEYAASMRYDSGRTDVDIWVDRPKQGDAAVRYWVRAVVCDKYYSGPPVNGGPVGYVDITAPGLPSQVTGFSITRQDKDSPAPTFTVTINFTRPADAEFWYAGVERIACDSVYNPLAGAVWEEVWQVGAYATAGVPASEIQGPWTYPPSSPEYWQFRAKSFSRTGIKNDTSPPTSNLYVPTVATIQGAKVVSIPAASFAAGLKPVELVSSLPGLPSGSYPPGTPVYKITESPPRLYRVNVTGIAWTAEVDGGDLIAWSVIAGKLAAGAVATSELYAGEIVCGVGGGKPTRFKVVDGLGQMLGFIGDEPGLFTGGYFRNLRVGPNIASPVITGDASGVTVSNATIVVVGAATTINIDPSNGFRCTGTYYRGSLNSGELRIDHLLYGSLGSLSPTDFLLQYSYGRSLSMRAWYDHRALEMLDNYGLKQIDIHAGATGYIDIGNVVAGGELRINAGTVIDANRRHRQWEIYSESLVLHDIVATKWVPCYDSSGAYQGKIPVIP